MVIVAGAGDKGAPVAHANRRAPGVILASSKNPRVVGAR